MSKNNKLRIAIFGTHSTGKTTLAKALSKKLKVPIIEDVVPDIVKTKFKKNNPVHLNESEYWEMEYRVYTYQLLTSIEYKSFVSDGGFLLDPIYLQLTYNPDKNLSAFRAFKNLCVEKTKEVYNYIFYLPAEIPLHDNNFRPQDVKYQKDLDKLLKKYLKENKVKYEKLTGSVKERVTKVIQIVNEAQ